MAAVISAPAKRVEPPLHQLFFYSLETRKRIRLVRTLVEVQLRTNSIPSATSQQIDPPQTQRSTQLLLTNLLRSIPRPGECSVSSCTLSSPFLTSPLCRKLNKRTRPARAILTLMVLLLSALPRAWLLRAPEFCEALFKFCA